MRFNSIEHLQAWQKTRQFPAIHFAIAGVVSAYCKGDRFLDLCCSFGLLGQRIKHESGAFVMGIDADADAIAKGKAAGIDIPLINMKVLPSTQNDLVQILDVNRINSIVARRALPELFGNDPAFGQDFVNAVADAGVKEFVIEGRAATRNATNALSSIDKEVALLSGRYKEARRIGAVSYLVLK